MPLNGKDNLKVKIRMVVETPGFPRVKSLGIIRDADSDPTQAFRKVRNALRYAQLPTPNVCLIPVGPSPKVIVMLMPKNNAPGMLEDLCLESVCTKATYNCVEQYFTCLRTQGLTLPREISKAKVHVFLASMAEPTLALGLAAQKGYWPFKSPVFDELKRFLTML